MYRLGCLKLKVSVVQFVCQWIGVAWTLARQQFIVTFLFFWYWCWLSGRVYMTTYLAGYGIYILFLFWIYFSVMIVAGCWL